MLTVQHQPFPVKAAGSIRCSKTDHISRGDLLRFPGRIFASIFGFDKKEMFKADEGARQAPKVEF